MGVLHTLRQRFDSSTVYVKRERSTNLGFTQEVCVTTISCLTSLMVGCFSSNEVVGVRFLSSAQMAYNKAWYDANKEKQKAWVKSNQEKIRKQIQAYKEQNGCMDCGIFYPYYVLDLDHRDPSTKLLNPSSIGKQGWGPAKIQEELDKCDVVCSNCHRSRTYLRGLKDKAADF